MKIAQRIIGILSLLLLPLANALANNCEAEEDLTQADIQARILMVGEGHGSKEMPEYLLKVACRLLREGKPVLIGLEVPASEQLAINNYLHSDGDEGDRLDLLRSIFWHRGRKWGMASEALFGVIETSRKWVKNGKQVWVFAFDQADASWPERLQKQESFWGGYRETIMALNIDVRARLYPKHTLLILTGELHATRDGRENDSYPTVAKVLAKRYTMRTFTFSHPEGDTWHCGGSRESMVCGSQRVPKSRFDVYPEFDKTIKLEKITASPPAVDK